MIYTTAVIYAETPQLNIMAEEKAKEMNATTLLSVFHDGLILRNAGDYLSFFEVSQFLITCKDWRQIFKSKERAIQVFWNRVG